MFIVACWIALPVLVSVAMRFRQGRVTGASKWRGVLFVIGSGLVLSFAILSMWMYLGWAERDRAVARQIDGAIVNVRKDVGTTGTFDVYELATVDGVTVDRVVYRERFQLDLRGMRIGLPLAFITYGIAAGLILRPTARAAIGRVGESTSTVGNEE